MHVSPKRNKYIHIHSIEGHILESVRDKPYLGLQISDDLKWSKYIRQTANKASIALGMVRRSLRFLQKSHKSTAYISLVRSLLECGFIVWHPYMQQDIQCIDRVSKAWRTLHSKRTSGHTTRVS